MQSSAISSQGQPLTVIRSQGQIFVVKVSHQKSKADFGIQGQPSAVKGSHQQ
jgi:hypothetical protein